MKKTIICLAALAMMAAGCSQKDDLAVTNTDPNAICFNAYTSTAVTRGVVKTSTDVQSEGIGVFAFYQPAVRNAAIDFNSRKYATPDFMYNQAVTYSNSKWTYTPTKYWPNNDSDQVSFFAYAPYDEDKTWEDLGIATDATASKITASFPIYNEKTAMQDILWTDPQLNKTKASTTSGATDNPIVFNFKHILSKVAIQVGVESDKATGQAGAWDYDGTDITINSIEFKGLAESYNFSKTIAASPVTTWTATGSQDIKLTEDDFQNYVIQATDRESPSQNVWNTAYWNAQEEENRTYYKTLLAQEGTSPDTEDGFLFFAPQVFCSGTKDLVITYTVLTKENWNSSTLGANDSRITNTIECSLADILPVIGTTDNHGFETGKAYTLKFLLGMNSVKVTSTVGTWDELDANQVDVPANTMDVIYAEGSYSGKGIKIGNTWWAPVNCGYDATSYPYGKLYQWGRKYGQGYNDSNYSDGDYPGKPEGSQSIEDISSGALTSHPDGTAYNGKFYKGQSQNWYGGTDLDSLWGATKTSYDPCPTGWRVPTSAELEALLGSATGQRTIGDGTHGSSTCIGLYYDGTTETNPTSGVFLPAAGYRNGTITGSAGDRGSYGYYRSSSASILYSGSSSAYISNFNRTCGYSVRCVFVQE